jgi:hypothetical protein
MTSSKKLIQASAGVGGGDFYPYTIDNSARFASSSDKLTRTNSGSGSTKGCFSMWVKRSKLNATQPQLIGTGFGEFYFTDSTMGGGTYYPDAIGYYEYFSSSYQGEGTSSINSSSAYSVFRDVSAWYHVFLVWDTTLATATDRYQIWINNQRVTLTGVSNVAQNTLARWFYTGDIAIGNNPSGTKPSLCYLAEVVGVEGTAYAPTDFAQDKNGVWVPKNISGLTFGTNGFYLDFSNSAALGTDVSGNGNNFTSSGLTSSDQVTDTPTNNFATLNVLDTAGSGLTISEGNLKFSSTTAAHTAIRATQGIPETGKWYWELCYVNLVGQLKIGVAEYDLPITSMSPVPYDVAGMWVMYNGGAYTYTGLNGTSYGPTIRSITSGSIAQCAYDADSGKIWFGWDGTWITSTGADNNSADPANGISPTATISTDKTLIPIHGGYNNTEVINFGQDGTFAGNKTAQGNADANGIGDFYYAPPSGYLALCTANLPEPTIGPNSDIKNDEVFDVVLYTGNGTAIGSGGKTISDYNFQPDMVWIKNRDSSTRGPMFTVTRGPTKYVNVDGGQFEVTDTESLTSFTSTGFTLGSSSNVNTSGNSYFSCAWKGGTEVSNTDGSITSNVSVNTDTGISIVEYTGTGTAGTIGHGLGVVPDFIDYKRLTSPDTGHLTWLSSDPTSMLYLSYTDATASSRYTNYMNAQPTTSTIPVTTSGDINGSGIAYQAMCFAEKENFSKITKYTSNASTDGPFIYCGFLPKWVLIKSANLNSTYWLLLDVERDTYNVADHTWLISHLGQAEYTASDFIDILSNGIKIRSTDNWINSSGDYYLMAFAENPFKYANAR